MNHESKPTDEVLESQVVVILEQGRLVVLMPVRNLASVLGVNHLPVTDVPVLYTFVIGTMVDTLWVKVASSRPTVGTIVFSAVDMETQLGPGFETGDFPPDHHVSAPDLLHLE